MRASLFVVALLIVVVAGRSLLDATNASNPPPIRGVTLDARTRPSDAELSRLSALGVTHLFVIPFGWQRSASDSALTLRTNNARWYSEDDDGIRDLDRRADSLGMYVVVKPHVWVRGGLSSEIGFDSGDDQAAWESGYRRLVMHYARLSAEIDAPLFVIGTELAGVSLEHPAYWRELIGEVRAEYSGGLTYAANWWEEYEHVTFWDALDFVGVQAYFPIDSSDVRGSWDAHLDKLGQLASVVDRPVLFTEIGYRSVGSAASEPWRWPERSEEAAPRPELQAELYSAFFERAWHRPWLAGAVVWKWRPGPVGESRRDRDATDFTVRDKPAEHIIGRWFSRE